MEFQEPDNVLYREESYRIMGACFEVYKEKGCGFLEAVYQECLEIELGFREIPFVAQAELLLNYKDRPLKQRYKPDLVCFGQIIVEIKAVSQITDEHLAQVHNYLHATGLRLGILVNFGHHPKLQYKRIVLWDETTLARSLLFRVIRVFRGSCSVPAITFPRHRFVVTN